MLFDKLCRFLWRRFPLVAGSLTTSRLIPVYVEQIQMVREGSTLGICIHYLGGGVVTVHAFDIDYAFEQNDPFRTINSRIITVAVPQRFRIKKIQRQYIDRKRTSIDLIFFWNGETHVITTGAHDTHPNWVVIENRRGLFPASKGRFDNYTVYDGVEHLPFTLAEYRNHRKLIHRVEKVNASQPFLEKIEVYENCVRCYFTHLGEIIIRPQGIISDQSKWFLLGSHETFQGSLVRVYETSVFPDGFGPGLKSMLVFELKNAKGDTENHYIGISLPKKKNERPSWRKESEDGYRVSVWDAPVWESVLKSRVDLPLYEIGDDGGVSVLNNNEVFYTQREKQLFPL